jgi:phosphoribosylamine---glycine ligase
MKILVVGSGGREHAIASAISRSGRAVELVGFLGSANPGLLTLCKDWMIGQLKDNKAVADYAWQQRADLVVVGPEVPLIAGLADELTMRGIPCVGPNKMLAQLEGSKAKLREVAARFAPDANPRYSVCHNRDEVKQFIDEVKTIVVKPIGLTSGKGVKVMGTQLKDADEAFAYAVDVLEKDEVVLLEECLVGEEFSQMIMTDGVNIVPMPLAQDAKYAFENNQGPMTGGMGVYTMKDHLLPFVSQQAREQAMGIIRQILTGLQDEIGIRYHGFLYGQFMLEKRGPVIVETNVRLGDPEAINMMALLKTDPVDAFMGMACGLPQQIEFQAKASVCKYLVPQDYPNSVDFNLRVKIDDAILRQNDTTILYAGVEKESELYKPTGSRFAAVLALREGLDEAEQVVEKTIAALGLKGLRHRKDIATPAAIKAKTERMKALLG